MATLATLEEFESELATLDTLHCDAAAIIDALIEELGHDEDYLHTLSHETPKWHWNYNPAFEFKRFAAAWQDGRHIYCLKPYGVDGELLPYRVFIAHDIKTDEYFALSLIPRKDCYDTNHDSYRRLCARYDGLRIPAIGRYA